MSNQGSRRRGPGGRGRLRTLGMLLATGAGLAVLGGCGLISSNVTDFTVRLPEREVTLDTADWELADAEALPAVDCGGDMATVCESAVADLCGAEACAGVCGGETCEVRIGVALWNTIDLARESPELEAIEGQPLVDVSVQRVFYRVTENSLDVASPVLEVRIANQSVMSLADAEPVGTIASVPAGGLVEDGEVEMVAGGEDTLTRYITDYGTPFNLIIGSDLTFRARDPIPTGRMVAVVGLTATAGL